MTEIDYDVVIENESEREFYKETHNKILEYLKRNKTSTFWEIVRNVQGSDRRVLRLLNQMRLAGEIALEGVQISSSGFNADEPNKRVQAPADGFNTAVKPSGLSFELGEEYKSIISKMERIVKSRPVPTFFYDQRPVTITTSVKRVAYLDSRGDLDGKRIVLIGDDDLTSLALGLTKRAKEIVVFDIDERLVDFINLISKEKRLKVRAYKYDLTKEIPSEFSGKFDIFLTDPTPNKISFELFISIGLNLLAEKGVGYVSFFPTHQAKSVDFQKILTERKVVITDMIPRFTEYDFVPQTYRKEDLKLLELFDSGGERLSFYENNTRFEVGPKSIREIKLLTDEERADFIGKATKRVLENPTLDPAYRKNSK
ncbi:bis-aminopropyl spermidine synthase family protein [Candidatus Pacearchaeota archaeon]|nr:bis-aminopropyl spermidine synthase family protein [Candidatus Pacearchaeota archaeon]